MELVGYTLQAKERKEDSASIFLDLSKAFNTLDHRILLDKLNRYGIRGVAGDWFKSYLKERSLVAKVTTGPNSTIRSDRYDITCGTAQGSCLGPLLFILFVNDIHLLPLYSKIRLFADDTTLFNSHKSYKYLSFMLEHDINLMMDWFNANKLSLNLHKTVSMHFWNKNEKPALSVNGYKIPTVTHMTFLGVWVDNELTWNNHVQHIIAKIRNNKRLMLQGKNLLDCNSLIKIYYAHIHSHLRYGLPVWGSMISTSNLNKLGKVQQKCVNIIMYKSNITEPTSRSNTSNIVPVAKMIQLALCKLGHQMTYKLLPQPLHNILNAAGGKKSHRYPMRNKDTPNIQKHQSTLFNHSFLCQSIVEYTKLSDTLKNEKNTRQFEKLL